MKPVPNEPPEPEISYALHQLLESAARQSAKRIAAEDPTGASISYRDLQEKSSKLRDVLRDLGVRTGDRVAFCMPKSIDSIISIFGILKAGAAYVPLDPHAPASRNAYILNNCAVKTLIVDGQLVDAIRKESPTGSKLPPMIVLDEDSGLPRLDAALKAFATGGPSGSDHDSDPDELAYILYTSGSTGKPKGVMISHRNAMSFIDWCSTVFEPTENDRYSSHAPLHFDLSIHDVFVPIKHAATIVLFSEETGKNPERLAQDISSRRVSVWYSTPSILGLLAQFGKLENHDYESIRLILFAGEVFPVKHLRAVKSSLPNPRYFNLYGPTETNVCTYFEIPEVIPDDRKEPFPIGRPCEHYEAMVLGTDGQALSAGSEGELLVRGPGVTAGYWQLPERTAAAFHFDENGGTWYKTGDIVIEENGGDFVFLGRRDRMVKKRGYRIELDEIESCLYEQPQIEEAGVVASTDEQGDVQIFAYVSTSGAKLSIIALKSFCAKRVPKYMIPDRFIPIEALPRTSTNKVDYQSLEELSK